MVSLRTYKLILLLSIVIGVLVYGFGPSRFSPDFLIFFAFVPFFMFAASVHGLIVHMTKPNTKGVLIIYPLIMGLLFALLLFIHTFVLLPLLCPDFLNVLQ